MQGGKKRSQEPKNQSPKIHNPHDSFFKAVMKQPPVYREFFEEFLPNEIAAKIDMATVVPAKDHFVSEHLKQLYSDCLFTAQLAKKPVFLYVLVEHQRKPDRFMALRFLGYLQAIWDLHLTKHPKTKKLPLILPFLLYNGEKPYPFSLDLVSLINAPENWVAPVIQARATLIDLNTFADVTLKRRLHLGVLTLAMKHILDDLSPMELLAFHLKNLPNKARINRLWHVVLKYYFEVREDLDPTQVASMASQHLTAKEAEAVMTTAERLRKEGRAEGMAEGMARGEKLSAVNIARNLLKAGMEPEFVARNTSLSLQEVTKLAKDL